MPCSPTRVKLMLPRLRLLAPRLAHTYRPCIVVQYVKPSPCDRWERCGRGPKRRATATIASVSMDP
eukprot:scaffold36310_cov118-Isochrysis_galbana.AAC.9